MSTIKASLEAVSAWMDANWRNHGGAAILAFVLGFAGMAIVQRLI